MPDANTQIDAHIDSAATLAKDISTGTTSWIWKLLGGIAVAFIIGWIKWELSQKEKELAQAKQDLELLKLKSQQDVVNSKIATMEEERTKAAQAAQDAAAKFLVDAQQLEAAQKRQFERSSKVQAIKDKDWDALNALAGVK